MFQQEIDLRSTDFLTCFSLYIKRRALLKRRLARLDDQSPEAEAVQQKT